MVWKMFLQRITALVCYSLIAASTIKPSHLWANETTIDSNAVVFAYHRIGEKGYPTTNVTIEQFKAHLEELQTGNYSILPLPQIINSIKTGKRLPYRTIGITFDDAYQSVYTRAWPLLRAKGFPFTIFVSTDAIDNKFNKFMSWNQIQELTNAGITLGSHTGSHLHMPKETLKINMEEIRRSHERFMEIFNKKPNIFAYPYGETSLKIKSMIKKIGFIAAFGQHSGAFDKSSDFYNLPRFSMNEKYAGIKRFKLAANTLAMQVTDVTPMDPFLKTDASPALGFTLKSKFKNFKQLSCFLSHNGKARIEILGNKRIEIRFNKPFPLGRTRLNCTHPGIGGRWHWFGRQFYRPN